MARFNERETLGPDAFAYPYGIGGFLVSGTTSAPVLYAATLSGGGVNAFVPDGAGGLTHIGSVAYPDALVAGVVPTMARFSVNGADALLVSGLPGLALVTAPGGAPQGWTSFAGGEGFGAFASAGSGLLLAASPSGGIVTLGATAGAPLPLSVVSGPVVSGIARLADGSVHAISAADDTITRYTLSAGGALAAGQVAGALDGLGWGGPSALRVAEVGGASYLIVAASGSSSLTVLAFDGGVYRVADHIFDDRLTRFDRVTALDTATVNGRTIVAAGGADDGVTLFELLPGGRLVHIQSFEDTPARALGNVGAVSLFRAGSHLQLVAAGQEGGVTVFSRPTGSLAAPILGGTGNDALTGSAADDLLVGGAGDDVLSGGGGDDILVDGDGRDRMRGGSGADIFVFVSDGEVDVVEDFQPGLDRLDLSAFAFLYAVSSLQITPVAGGARLVFGDEVIEVRTASGASLDASDFAHADILGVTRPPFVQIGREVVGTAGSDTLFGADAGDRLGGLAGDDTIDGGEGRDLASGGADADEVLGGPGGDLLMGGPGHDFLSGGAGADVIVGGSGNDRIDGGPGNDTLRGGPGADVFVFLPGSDLDRIADFQPGLDLIDLSGHPGFAGWSAIRAAVSEAPDGAAVSLGGGDKLLLTGIDPGALSADDFLF